MQNALQIIKEDKPVETFFDDDDKPTYERTPM